MVERKLEEVEDYIRQIEQLEAEVIRLNKRLSELEERSSDIRQSYEGFIDFQTSIVQLRRINEPSKIIVEFLRILKKHLPFDKSYFYPGSPRWKHLQEIGNIAEDEIHTLEEDGIFEWVLNSGHVIVLPSQQEQNKTYVLIPLRAWEENIGTLLLKMERSNDSFSVFDLELLNLMATETAQSAQNAQLFAEVKQTRDFLDQVINSYHDFIFETDLDGNVGFRNTTFKDKFSAVNPSKFLFDCMKWKEGELEQLLLELKSGIQEKTIENELILSDDEIPYRWNISAIQGTDGSVKGYLWIGTNILEEKKKERERLQSERLKTVLQVARSINHEINSPLTAIMGHLELLLFEETDNEKKQIYEIMLGDLKRIRDIAQRLQKLKELTTEEYFGDQEIISLNKVDHG